MSERPTLAQIDYVEQLCIQLGYDVDDYDPKGMSNTEISALIDELKEELEG